VFFYISSHCPPGITNRDFVHIRIEQNDEERGISTSLDQSVTHPSHPETKSYIRAHTFFSGLLLTRKEDGSTRYSAVSQADVRGDVPKILVNALASKSTADWFASLEKACADYVAGKFAIKTA